MLPYLCLCVSICAYMRADMCGCVSTCVGVCVYICLCVIFNRVQLWRISSCGATRGSTARLCGRGALNRVLLRGVALFGATR